MDGVLADFEWAARYQNLHPKELKKIPGIYRHLPIFPGAPDFVKFVKALDFEIFVCTKCPKENTTAASDKWMWLNDNFPIFEDHIIITPDKGCIGSNKDYLIDDHPEWANADKFSGTICHFTGNWEPWYNYFRDRA